MSYISVFKKRVNRHGSFIYDSICESIFESIHNNIAHRKVGKMKVEITRNCNLEHVRSFQTSRYDKCMHIYLHHTCHGYKGYLEPDECMNALHSLKKSKWSWMKLHKILKNLSSMIHMNLCFDNVVFMFKVVLKEHSNTIQIELHSCIDEHMDDSDADEGDDEGDDEWGEFDAI